MKPTFWTCLFALACVVPVRLAAALDLSSVVSDYRVTSWVGGDNITLGEVRGITQDADGYLWIASDSGLVRFDGFRFTRSDLVAGSIPLPNAPTRAVYFASDESLWIGYGERRGLYRVRHGEVRDVFLENQIEGLFNVILEDRRGSLWVGHDDGLFQFDGERWATVDLPGSGPRVLDLHEDRDGVLWVAATSGLYRRTPDGRIERAPHVEGAARAISEDQSGRLWVTDDRVGFRRADAARWNSQFEARGMGLFHDSRGNLWVTTIGQGLWQVRTDAHGDPTPSVRRATAQTGLVSDESSVIFEDRDGNIWVGSIQGLNRLTPHQVLSIVDIGLVRSLALDPKGSAWVGTTTGLLELTGVTPRSPGRRRVVTLAGIRALHTARNGTIWAATDEGLYSVRRDRLVPASPAASLKKITSIASDRQGGLWVCDGAHGVVRIVDGVLERVARATDGLAAAPLLAYVDRDDRVWIAFRGGVVRRLDSDGRVTQFGLEDGLTHTAVYTFHHDRWGDFWIGGNRGLSRLHGHRFRTVTFRNEALGRSVTGMADDDDGDVWVGLSFFGFIRLSRQDVARALDDPSYRPRYRLYSTASGAGYPDPVYDNVSRMNSDHALWFITSRGLSVLDPRELRRQQEGAPGPPRIEGITADDRRYTAAAEGTVFPPRTRQVRVDYTVVGLSSLERVRFRHRLDGFDTTWVDGTGPRQAFYTNLPPGTYRFRVQASTNASEWSDAEAGWAFSIEPTFYETRWFYALCAIGLLACALGAWQFRVRQVRRELALVYGERLRLSRELHDTLLQSLYGIGLQLDVASLFLRPGPSPLEVHLQRIRRQIADYVAEARQSIWDLRSPVLEQCDLVGALRDTGDRLTAGKVPFVFRVSGTPRPCPSKLETHVLRIGREAVMNAVRHSQARQVEMEIAFEDRSVRLRVADDGRGFGSEHGPDVTPLGHYGLTSMKERAADAGGRCTITSAPGAGVQVIAEFPLMPAA